MEAFATVDDLKATGRTLDVSDEQAEVLLERASAQLATLLARHGIEVDPSDEVQATNLCTVTCSMVLRSISDGKAEGVSNFAQTIGSTNVSVTYRASDGSFYLSKSDKELLGISGRGGFRMLRSAIRNPDGTPAEGW